MSQDREKAVVPDERRTGGKVYARTPPPRHVTTVENSGRLYAGRPGETDTAIGERVHGISLDHAEVTTYANRPHFPRTVLMPCDGPLGAFALRDGPQRCHCFPAEFGGKIETYPVLL